MKSWTFDLSKLYRHAPQKASLVKLFPVERFVIFNIQTSQNVHISQYSAFQLIFV
jgi:hypothetical protein